MFAAAFAHGDFFRLGGKGERFRMNQGVMEHDVRCLEQARGAQGQQVGRTRTGAHQIDGALHAFDPVRRRNSGWGRSTELW